MPSKITKGIASIKNAYKVANPGPIIFRIKYSLESDLTNLNKFRKNPVNIKVTPTNQ